MRFALLFSTSRALLVSLASCSSSSDACDKACPNDPDLTQTQIDQCKANAASDKCASACKDYSNCLSSHQKDTCGADGKSDPTKTIAVATVTCKPSSECTACVSKK